MSVAAISLLSVDSHNQSFLVPHAIHIYGGVMWITFSKAPDCNDCSVELRRQPSDKFLCNPNALCFIFMIIFQILLWQLYQEYNVYRYTRTVWAFYILSSPLQIVFFYHTLSLTKPWINFSYEFSIKPQHVSYYLSNLPTTYFYYLTTFFTQFRKDHPNISQKSLLTFLNLRSMMKWKTLHNNPIPSNVKSSLRFYKLELLPHIYHLQKW